ncbi:MAG TPA: hypothetical protein VJ783_29240 [Pirellulales bacterium]|nr:hypothetical protein [Pirellulales bacterium]
MNAAVENQELTETEALPATETQAAVEPLSAKPAKNRRGRPKRREIRTYEQWVSGCASQTALARKLNVSRPRVVQIIGKVERWLAAHPDDQMAARIRVRCTTRLELLYVKSMESFAKSRKKVETFKNRTMSRMRSGCQPVVTTVEERVKRDPLTGNVRFLNAAMRSVERMWRLYADIDGRKRNA